MISPISQQPLAARVAEELLARIRQGEWPLGHKLPGETTLAAQLGVGRSSLREAIRELAGKGVLTSRQGAGVFVTALDVEQGLEDVVRAAEVTAVIEARIAVETEAAHLAASRRTSADIRLLRKTLAAREAARGVIEDYVDTDTEFHRAVLAAAHNEVLSELFDTFVPRIRQAMIAMLRAQPRPAATDADGHGGLIEAIVNRDAELARTLSRAHLTELLTNFTAR
ncbi:FadR family transcriptional regulator [Mycetocola tolaasinivorans]|uniref:FadR family transcriptional regulator n=1 Tax=Mycetocola tolaasinivorans TaxID=76635 RepID=A0A3L7A536_9MICO|nr:FadR/GntR family transcriptional regulator [Mycetocola tolaasinivorans]RLP75058.1 FadR family transcriptional regulator [Mycetocola tolaasinivorans]